MWWKRKPKVNPYIPKAIETAEEMSQLADEQCEKITRIFYSEILEQILKQSHGGNKSWVVPEKFFDEITVIYKVYAGRAVVKPTIDFKLLKTLLTDKGYNVVTKDCGRISVIFWVKTKK